MKAPGTGRWMIGNFMWNVALYTGVVITGYLAIAGLVLGWQDVKEGDNAKTNWNFVLSVCKKELFKVEI